MGPWNNVGSTDHPNVGECTDRPNVGSTDRPNVGECTDHPNVNFFLRNIPTVLTWGCTDRPNMGTFYIPSVLTWEIPTVLKWENVLTVLTEKPSSTSESGLPIPISMLIDNLHCSVIGQQKSIERIIEICKWKLRFLESGVAIFFNFNLSQGNFPGKAKCHFNIFRNKIIFPKQQLSCPLR